MSTLAVGRVPSVVADTDGRAGAAVAVVSGDGSRRWNESIIFTPTSTVRVVTVALTDRLVRPVRLAGH
ncbi:unnamed protein product [Soboliphyme baturini]|uniref:CHAT domain-containing protein n=1 Tax=Soboliphyme baturini TaxID=241478 RepID=A0A183ITV7_9BILA|nr:unnamed protein product [Soboliphyme baturini]